MEIIISNSSKKPIYEQITDQLKQQIISGVLQEGDALPSMRALARDLHISVITKALLVKGVLLLAIIRNY